MSESKHVWVFLETEDGQLRSVGLELLGQGRLLADKMGEQLVGVILDPHAGHARRAGDRLRRRHSHHHGRSRLGALQYGHFHRPPCATSCANTRPKCS